MFARRFDCLRGQAEKKLNYLISIFKYFLNDKETILRVSLSKVGLQLP